jgi:hypothetical protein
MAQVIEHLPGKFNPSTNNNNNNKRKQLKYVSMDEWINKTWCTECVCVKDESKLGKNQFIRYRDGTSDKAY